MFGVLTRFPSPHNPRQGEYTWRSGTGHTASLRVLRAVQPRRGACCLCASGASSVKTESPSWWCRTDQGGRVSSGAQDSARGRPGAGGTPVTANVTPKYQVPHLDLRVRPKELTMSGNSKLCTRSTVLEVETRCVKASKMAYEIGGV